MEEEARERERERERERQRQSTSHSLGSGSTLMLTGNENLTYGAGGKLIYTTQTPHQAPLCGGYLLVVINTFQNTILHFTRKLLSSR